ncbi:uncharacterized protein ColSpa_12262 [Colletotrichum spaethianum]|uniref:Uncharacterized protein n=1 Tax=Colletotrichum spaethianum TaxID=700344 RepID=A0AA37ULM2_9PEZI|nr:uncharacterized protein ColSpa_12262 [Colletotrichum spaethianum]GKT52081.1 hypothetical protein ColSpa_12262 [Colletotrichum spaethianum]
MSRESESKRRTDPTHNYAGDASDTGWYYSGVEQYINGDYVDWNAAIVHSPFDYAAAAPSISGPIYDSTPYFLETTPAEH